MKVLEKYKYKKEYKKLILSAYFFYIAVVAIKLTYSAQMVEIISYFKTTKSQVATGLTIYYFVYAVAQFVLGLFVHKLNMKKFLTITCALSAISFAMIGITSSLWQVWLIFGLNGIFQSASWGGLIHVLGKRLPVDTLSFVNKFLTTGFAIGNSLTYALSALFVAFLSWKVTFVFIGVLFLISLVNLMHKERLVKKVTEKGDEVKPDYSSANRKEFLIPEGRKFNVKALSAYLLFMAFLTNCLSYGFANWIAVLLKEVHSFPVALSILITLIVPLVEMPARLFVMNYFDRTNRIFSTGSLYSFITLILLGIMIFFYDLSLVFAIAMCVLLRFFISGFVSGYSTYTAMKLKNYLNLGTASLVNNSGAAVGAGIMPLITAFVMDSLGWQAYYIFLTSLCALAFIVAFSGYLVVKKKGVLADCF